MTDRTFVNLVARMREAQNAYFRDRSKANLIEAFRLEKQVDTALRNNEVGDDSGDRSVRDVGGNGTTAAGAAG